MKTLPSNHTVGSFDKELGNITKNIHKMAENLVAMLDVFKESIGKPQKETIKKVAKMDDKIDELEQKVEAEAMAFIALRSPMAIDLRFVISAIRIATILERCGDIAQNSTNKIVTLDSAIPKNYAPKLDEMATSAIKMILNAVHGFQKYDVHHADKVWRREDEVDELADEMFDIIKSDIKKNPAKTDSLLPILLVVKALERIADYAVKITKIVHYIESGKRISEKDIVG
jgi:phosphate transport system protein